MEFHTNYSRIDQELNTIGYCVSDSSDMGYGGSWMGIAGSDSLLSVPFVEDDVIRQSDNVRESELLWR